MEKPHTNTRTTTSATEFYNSLMKAFFCGTPPTNIRYGPPDVYVDCEVQDVEDDHENS